MAIAKNVGYKNSIGYFNTGHDSTNYAIKILTSLTYFQEVGIEQTLNIFGKNINQKEN